MRKTKHLFTADDSQNSSLNVRKIDRSIVRVNTHHHRLTAMRTRALTAYDVRLAGVARRRSFKSLVRGSGDKTAVQWRRTDLYRPFERWACSRGHALDKPPPSHKRNIRCRA